MSSHKCAAVAFVALFIVLEGVVLAANGTGWQIKISAPVPNANPFPPNGQIRTYNGATSWPKGSDSIDDVAMYTLTGSSNPFKGVNVSSNYANYTPTENKGGGGTGTFNAQNVTPVLLAPNSPSTRFYVVAVPENAATGAYKNAQGAPYEYSVTEKTSN